MLMNSNLTNLNRRILVIDDNHAIHDDFRKILGTPDAEDAALREAESLLFGTTAAMLFEIDTASQGEEGLQKVEQAMREGRPYAMAFVDVRMPPGWDGIETTQRIWQVCPDLQVVLCTAFADTSWDEMRRKFDSLDRLLILKKPFDTIEILQMANALTQKWLLLQESRMKLGGLEQMVWERTRELEESKAAAVNMMGEAVRSAEKAEQAVADLRHEMAERSKLEEKFREQASLLDKTREAILVHELDSRITYWNKGAERLYGWAAAEAVGQPAELLCMNADAFLQASEQVTQTGEWTGELKQRSKDGRNLIIEGHWTLVRDDSGTPRSILAINNDITARKHADEAIQMQGRVLESMTEGVVVCDEAGTILFSNAACNAMFGYDHGELAGQHFSVLKSSTPDEGRREVDGMLDALQSRGVWAGEIPSRKKDGMSFVTGMRISIVDTTGARSFVVVVEDITEKKSMEAQFLRSQRMESVGRLSSGIAHDMNNILTPILLSAFMLRRPLPGEDYDNLLGNIETSAQRGAALIKQLLTLGCEPGGQRKMLSTASLVDDMMQIMQGTFPKNINLTCRVAADVWPVTGDATQLHQVLLNLCVNARDAMPLGGALMLTVENVRFDESYAAMSAGIQPGPYVMLRVSDTGEGIPSDTLDKIFDPFFTTKETGKGTGLGLSTVMGIAKSHGGFVNVRSLVGSGTTFEVCLPAVPEGAMAEAPARPRSAPPRGQGETILVVDDEPNIRDVVRRTLTGHGYRVLTASDGTEAVVLFTEHREQIKAVLTDIMMPFMDGVTMVRTMRKMAPAVKIVASTGMGSARGREDKTAALHTLGVRTLLTKPYTADEVLSTIGDLLAQPAVMSA